MEVDSLFDDSLYINNIKEQSLTLSKILLSKKCKALL